MLHRAWLSLVAGSLAALASAQGKVPVESGSDWAASAQAELERAEHRFQPVQGEEGVWSAPNRGHELRSRVSRAGLEVFPRETGASGAGAVWTLRLATVGLGRAGDAWPLEGFAVSADGARAELDHGALVEWFENSERGIEQGWTIARPPAGAGELEITLSVAGDLSLRLDEGGRSGTFVDACGVARVDYEGLLAWDATGRELAARLAPTPAGVAVRVDDVGATYPITVDPLLTNPAWTAESDQVGAYFGGTLATAGDVNGDGYSDVIVAALSYDNGQGDEGRAFVYLGSASGLAASASWSAKSDQTNFPFGTVAVATAGDVNGDGYSDVIVGADLYDNDQNNEGRAFVYMGSASGLAASAAWTAEGDQIGAQFGASVATAGDVNGDGYSDVIVGALSYDNGQTNEGRAFVYLGSASGLAASAAWTAESDQTGAQLGNSVAPGGDVNGDGYSDVIVGAYGYDNGQNDEGRAYVYLGSASGLAASAAWTAESNQASAFFGISVATAGDVNGDGYSDVIVGAYLYDNGQIDEGRAFVYMGSASGLAASASWTAESNQANTGLTDWPSFGEQVATAGDVNGDGYSDVIVGAYAYDNGQTNEGRAYVYMGSASGLAASAAWTAESNQADAWFAVSVGAAGDVNGDGYGDVIIGASKYNNGQIAEGRAFVYHGSAAGLVTSAGWTTETNQAGAQIWWVSTAGDVNGDGYSDVVVGSNLYDNGQTDEGAVFVYHGSAAGPSATPDWTAEGNQASASFGYAASTAGDVNGDGYSDVIVGAYLYDNGQADEGRCYVYLGSASGLGASPAWTAESNQADSRFGISAATVGDVNGDGYSDVIVGAYWYDNGETNEGRAFVFLGSSSGLAPGAAWTAESNQAGAEFGRVVASAGDVNADGYSDALVGAWFYDNGEVNEGRVFVYHGSAGGLAASAAWTAEGNQASADFGYAAATAGDVNGDGYSDVIVGAYLYDNGQTNEGRSYIYLGSASGLGASPVWTAESNQAEGRFGISVATVGDVNGDGYSDVIVGAYQYDNGEANEGRAYVFLGSSSGLAPGAAWTVESNQSGAELGLFAASAGDVNADGYSDVIVGIPHFAAGQTNEGQARIYYGNGGDGGLVRELQQRTSTGVRPIAVVGSTGQSGLFRIRCEFRKSAAFSWASPAPEAWLEWEVKPLGVPFDGSGIQRGMAQALVPAGGTLTFDEPTSVDDAAGPLRTAGSYHWRARIATSSPLFPHTAWFSAPGNNVTEAKLRKPKAKTHT